MTTKDINDVPSYSAFPVLDPFIDAAVKDMQEQLDEGSTDTMTPALALLRLNEDKTEITGSYFRDVSEFHESEIGKVVLAKIMDAAFFDPASPVDALVYLSEAYFVERTSLDTVQETTPSEAADRKEALVIVARTKSSAETFIFEIDREAKKLTRKDVGTQAAGRMTGTPIKAPEGATVH